MTATRALLMTPAGRGAVATIAVWGEQAWRVVADCFWPATSWTGASAPEVGRVLFGHWPLATGEAAVANIAPTEEVVVCRVSPDCVEIHCHGGPAAWRAIVDTLVSHGCQAGDWNEAAALACDDPISAEAAIALCQATTQRTASILLDQYSGALMRAIASIRDDLNCDQVDSAGDALKKLLAWESLGRHLNSPFKVVLAGAPNVGKSSLMNTLAGYERSIVYDQPGTTRDVVTAATAIDGWPVELSDTAGLRPHADELESAGIAAARRQLFEADLVVLVFDASLPWMPADEDLLQDWPKALAVRNKCDLAPAGAGKGLLVSAITGQGVDELLAQIARRLVPEVPQPGEAVPFLPRHFEMLRNAALRIEQGDTAAAREGLVRD